MKTITTEPIEFEGKTVERAVEAACRHFGLSEDQLEIEILTKGSTGIFGLGGRKAKIKVVPKVVQVEEATPEAAVPEEEYQEAITPPAESEAQVEPPPSEMPEERPPEQKDMPEVDREEVLHAAKEIGEEILKKAGLEARIEIAMGDEGPYLNILGEDLSLIIGREGQTLGAIEYIINRMVARQLEGARGVMVDAQGYREKRKQSLVSLAHKMAQKAKRTGRPVALNPMGARERRIVHLSLRNFPGIRTRSVGEGGERKVIISPLNKRYKGRKRGPRR